MKHPSMSDNLFTPKIIQLHKLEVARRQLVTAIELWFRDGDPVSIHSLAYAAHEIIHVIHKRRGGPGLMFTQTPIKPEHRNEFNIFVKQSANFIKHVKADWDSCVEFNITAGLSFIAITVVGLLQMGESLTDAEAAFMTWMRLHQPNWFYNDISEYGIDIKEADRIRSMGKSKFYDTIVSGLKARRGGLLP